MSDLRLEKKDLRYDQTAAPVFPVEDGIGTPAQGKAAGDAVTHEVRVGFDISFAEDPAWGQLQEDNGLRSAVLLSLFTDRIADVDDDVPDSTNPGFPERRGYWADFLSPLGPDDRYGSRLWLLRGKALTQDTRATAAAYCLESLAWVEGLGIGTVDIETSIPRAGELAIEVVITDSTTRDERRYSFLWDAMIREGV